MKFIFICIFVAKGVLNYSYVPVEITEYQRQKVYLGIAIKHEKSLLVFALSFSLSISLPVRSLLIILRKIY